ncbi:MAG: Fe-S cluster assembly ATPase SufC [Bacilli bacterium]
MLKIDNLTVEVEKKEILKDFSLEIKDGEIHALLGPNGIGKSTICKTLLHDPNYTIKKGNIIYQNQDLNLLSTTEIARLGINMINQSPIAIEGVTNAEMLRTALSEKNNERVDIFAFNKKLENICAKLEIPKSFIHRNINDGMSGGERKKNELLHLWMLEPSFVILDEIDSGLDVDALKIVANSLKEYHSATNCSMLIVTHNSKLLEILKPDYVHILDNKHIIKTGDMTLAKEIENLGFNNINKADELGENK